MADKVSRGSVAVPIIVITVGIGWLLTVRNVIPGINWIWTLGLAVGGLLTLIMGGVNKMTVVVGPFLILATVFSLLRQTGRLSADTEVPCLVILGGTLALLARILPVPDPRWADQPPSNPT